MEDIAYRRGTEQDISALIALRAAFLAEVAGADPSDPALLAALERCFRGAIPSGEFIAFVAVAGESIVGSSGMVYHRHPPSAANLHGVEAYIMNMYTLPQWRGRGIGSGLLCELIAVATETGCSRIRLHTYPNAAAIYARAGFVSGSDEMTLNLLARNGR